MARPDRPCIFVIAGCNGAGKSSLAGAAILEGGGVFFNPDEAAVQIRMANPGLGQQDANSAAWHEGKRLLERAIRERRTFAFETTLGGKTIAGLLEQALDNGCDVRVWFAGLETVELHIARVRARAARGGHDIPEEAIRQRFDGSRRNLTRLLPKLTELRLYDNSAEAGPEDGHSPRPKAVMHVRSGRIVTRCPLAETPGWAKPIVAAALKLR